MSERQLLERARGQDRAAIEELFRREWRAVYDLVYRTVQNRSEAQDLTQDVFLRAFRSLDRYQDTGKPFRQYLNTIALNLLRDRWRTRKPPNTDLDSIGTLAADDRSPEEHLLLNADAAMLRAALAELSDDHRRVIQLRVIEGRSSQEAGDIMGRNPDAIRQLQRRALVALRATLREELPL
jgi:RNA polymerase sigma-70 factor (ECF subfamily)